ncbi:MAG: hypothetical protein Q9181_006820 [Wetmoreana brouardii]
MALAESPWKSAKDSPSRQLLWELSRLRIYEQEEFYEQLDRESQEREAAHKNALAIAIARHEQVRKDAEAERDRQIKLEAERREAEARQEEERERQARAERENAEKQRAAERAEAAARAERAATREREAEAARQKAEKDRRDSQAAEAKKQEQEAKARKKAEDERKSEEAATARSSQKTQPIIFPTQQSLTSNSQSPLHQLKREEEHKRYLEIHKSLKEMRNFMTEQAKQNPKLKSRTGDMRREIKKSIGQLREGKGANTVPHASIQKTLKEAVASFPQPTISLANFTASPQQDAQAPALLVFLLNHLSKSVVAQFIKEAAVSPKIADPIGTIAISIFANNEFRVNGHSLIDILIAKMHVVCPPLFGIYGPEDTQEGRTRLGWWREFPEGPWISEQAHQDRMTGLGAGYAALSLRNFEKSKMSNPYPPYHFWRALTAIINVPAGQVTETHLVVLKALLTNCEARFLEFFGEPARKLLQFAVKEYPKRAPKGSVAAAVLSNLGETMKKDKKLYL